MWHTIRRRALIVLAMLGLLLAGFALLLLIQGHPHRLAWRGEPSVYVPYWDTFQRPPEVFNGSPTVGKFDGVGLNYVRVSNGTESWWNLWIEPALFAGATCAIEVALLICLFRDYRRHDRASRGFDVMMRENVPSDNGP